MCLPNHCQNGQGDNVGGSGDSVKAKWLRLLSRHGDKPPAIMIKDNDEHGSYKLSFTAEHEGHYFLTAMIKSARTDGHMGL